MLADHLRKSDGGSCDPPKKMVGFLPNHVDRIDNLASWLGEIWPLEEEETKKINERKNLELLCLRIRGAGISAICAAAHSLFDS